MSRSLYRLLHQIFEPPELRALHFERVDQKIDALIEKYPLENWLGQSVERHEPSRHVVIAGGGFAGLMAAACLAREYKVTVLEASDRWGGRARTRNDIVEGTLIEAGGELIGANHPAWLWLARYFKLGLSVVTDADVYKGMGLGGPPVTIQGPRRMTSKKLGTVEDRMTEALKSLVKRAFNDLPLDEHAHAPWKANAKDDESLEDWIVTQPSTAQKELRAHFESDHGALARDQSLLGILCQIRGGSLAGDLGADDSGDLEGPNRGAYFTASEVFRACDGSESLANVLYKYLRARGANLLLQSPVTSVRVDAGQVHVGYRWDNEERAADVADFAVVATPPWTTKEIEFTPSLPFEMGKIGRGMAVKYLSDVAERFWLADGVPPIGFIKDFGQFWEPTCSQVRTSRAAGLSVFAGGTAAESAIGHIDADEHFLAGLDGVLNGYREAWRAGELIRWPEEPLIGAGYASPKTGQVNKEVRMLNAPHQDRVFFAGEHTCPAFFGYMEGALQSGCRVAKEIRTRVSKPKSKRTPTAKTLRPRRRPTRTVGK